MTMSLLSSSLLLVIALTTIATPPSSLVLAQQNSDVQRFHNELLGAVERVNGSRVVVTNERAIVNGKSYIVLSTVVSSSCKFWRRQASSIKYSHSSYNYERTLFDKNHYYIIMKMLQRFVVLGITCDVQKARVWIIKSFDERRTYRIGYANCLANVLAHDGDCEYHRNCMDARYDAYLPIGARNVPQVYVSSDSVLSSECLDTSSDNDASLTTATAASSDT